jgi:hypothetical protein
MTNNAYLTSETHDDSSTATPGIRRLSPVLCASAAALAATGIATGLDRYLTRTSISEAHVPGTSAWPQHLVVAAVACALYGIARWRQRRQFGPRSGRLLLLAPFGRAAAARLTATARRAPGRTAAAVPPLALIAYCCWRIGEQVTAGLDPSFTANAWGGPTYLGAMACHYLDCALLIAACAWLLGRILFPVPREGT